MKNTLIAFSAALLTAVLATPAARAQENPVAIDISGWTGFAPIPSDSRDRFLHREPAVMAFDTSVRTGQVPVRRSAGARRFWR